MREPNYIEEQYDHDSIVTTSTFQTFTPPHSDTVSVSNLTLKSVQEPKMRVLTLSGLNSEATQKLKFKKSRDTQGEVKSTKKFVFLLLCCFTFLLLLGGVGFALNQSFSTEAEESELSEDFCGELNLTDNSMRQILAENFDSSLILGEGRELSYPLTLELGCLPEEAFSQLNQTQKDIFRTLDKVSFVEVVILKVHPKAFEEELVKDIAGLFFSSTKFTELPDDVFQPFKGLFRLTFSFQLFKELDNNLFGEDSSLTELIITNCGSLGSFPEMMRETPKLEILRMTGAGGLVNGNRVAFENLNNLELLEL